MTQIQKIVMNGFKSFAHKTELILGDKFNCVLGPNGSGKCVTGDTIVSLADGTKIRIDELVNKQKNRSNMDDGWVAPGDGTKILSMNKNMKIKSQEIKAFVKRTSPEKLISITTRSGRKIKTTPYHPLFTLKEGTVKAIRADELKEGIRVAVPRKLNVNIKNKTFIELLDIIKKEDGIFVPWNQEIEKVLKNNKQGTWKLIAEKAKINAKEIKGLLDKQAINFVSIVKLLRSIKIQDKEIPNFITYVKSKNGNVLVKFPWKNSNEFSRILGYLLAEGRLSKNNQIWFTNGTEELIKDYAICFKKVFNIKTTINEYKPNVWDVLAYSKPLISILKHFGVHSAGNKKLTSLYLSHSKDGEIKHMLGALYAGDGYISKNIINIVTKSIELANGIETCLLRLGITPRRKTIMKIATNSGFSGMYESINLYGKENYELFSKIYTAHPTKSEKIINLLGKKGNTNVDLIEANDIIKKAAKGLNIKKLKKNTPNS